MLMGKFSFPSEVRIRLRLKMGLRILRLLRDVNIELVPISQI